MVKRAMLPIATALAAATACTAPSVAAARPDCPRAWVPAWSADSIVALCLPPDFRRDRERSARWQREWRPGAPVRDDISVAVDSVAAWARGDVSDHWPPTLVRGPCVYADCVTSDSLVTHTDTVGGAPVRVETARLTGGAVGMRRVPMLAAGWALGARRVRVGALAERPATLDTLRMALRTLRVAPRGVVNWAPPTSHLTNR